MAWCGPCIGPESIWYAFNWNGTRRDLKITGKCFPLGIRGSSAWFHQHARIFQLDLETGFLQQTDLPNDPLGAPLVTKDQLWLLEHELILIEQGQIKARFLHGLTCGRRAGCFNAITSLTDRPGGDNSRPGQQLPLAGRSLSIARCLNGYQSGILNRAGRHAEALAQWENLTPEQQRSQPKNWPSLSVPWGQKVAGPRTKHSPGSMTQHGDYEWLWL